MTLRWICGLALLAATNAPLGGNEILARAGAADGLTSYSVPVHFDVHMHRPIGIRDGADAIVYFRAPAQAELTITKISGIIGRFFKGSYAIDLAPQVWPAKYTVTSVSTGAIGTTSTLVLNAVPKAEPSVDRVVFTVAQSDDAPLGATWFYKDGSTIQLTLVCQTTPDYSLVERETIAVNMPRFSLDANGVFGAYALNTPIPDSVFQTK